MFGTIRKHQTWLWAVIITLTIISFLYFFLPNTKLGNGAASTELGSINGKKVSREAFVQAEREVFLQYFFRNGNWPSDDARKSGFDERRETYQWLLLTQKQEEAGIHISSDVLAQTGREMLRPLERANVTGPDVFIKQVLEPKGFTVDDFERFVRHYLGIQELIATYGLSGRLVTPEEAKGLYVRENQELVAQAVLFSTTNFLSAVSVPADAISQFYSNRVAMYRIPDRVQVSYVRFGVTNLLAQAEQELNKTNFNEIIEANFQRVGTNTFKDAKTPEEIKAKIRSEIIRSRAMAEARKQAAEFATVLFDKQPARAENLEQLAKEKGLKPEVSLPFDREQGPSDLEVGADFTKIAFTRTSDDPFGGPIAGRDGFYVFAIKGQLPSEIPPLTQVKAKVEQDYKMSQASSMARTAGATAYTAITNGLAHGKTFEAACAEAKVTPLKVPPLSLRTPSLTGDLEDHLNLNQLKQLAFSTFPGQVSPFQPTAEGGIILYVEKKLPIDEKKMQTELPEFVNSVRQTRQNEAFNDWFRKELEKGMRDTPLARPQPPAMNAGPQKS
jgi:hypothetical protein